MAYRIPNTTTPWSTAANWDTVTNVPTLHASTNITVSSGGVYSHTFTAPNTTNACTGVMVLVSAVGSAGSIVATLQENSVSVASTATTLTITNLTAGTWVYFRFATPYVFTSTTAGYYRIKLNTSGASGTTSVAADTDASNFCYFVTDNRTGVPANTDDVFIVGQNDSTPITVTVDGSRTIGSGTNTTIFSTTASSNYRSLGNAIMLDKSGTLQWDTTASATLTMMGHLVVNKGTWNMGTVAAPMPADIVATLTINQNGTSGNYGIVITNSSLTNVQLQGFPKHSTTSWKTKYASGVGTAADPMIITALQSSVVTMTIASPCIVTYTGHGLSTGTPIFFTTTGALPTGLAVGTKYYVKKIDADTFNLTATIGGANIDTSGTQSGDHTLLVSFEVGDEIMVSASSDNATNYQESENKFIKTINSATSYVISDTAGGAESAFTYTHNSNAWVLNLQRNVIINSSNAAEGWYLHNYNATAGNVNIDWIRVVTCGMNTTNKMGFMIHYSQTGSTATVDYSVNYGSLLAGWIWTTSKAIQTHTGLIACNGVTASTAYAFRVESSANNKTLVDCFAIKNDRIGFSPNSCANNIFTRCIAISNNLDAQSFAGFYLSTCFKLTFNDCESHANRQYGIFLNNTADIAFNTLLDGTKGKNSTADICCTSDSYNAIVFNNSTFGSDIFVSNYLNLIPGSQVKFHNLSATTNKHRFYNFGGIGQTTGAGLTDTTVRTAGSLAVRLAPEDSTDGLIWEFKILAKANSAVSFFGYFRKNAAFGTDSAYVELFLPGSTTADDTCTISNTTEAWEVCSVSANYTGSVDLYATIRITAKTTTASAYLYCDDFYNGSNKIIALDTWDGGMPSPIMFEQLGDASAVWSQLTAANNTDGTFGKQANSDDKFIKSML